MDQWRGRARQAACGEGGFTLPELLIALTIQALILGALALAFITIMKGGSQASQSLDKTGDARIAAFYIVGDARNSSGPELSLTDTSSCPDASPPVAGTASPVLRLSWPGTDSDGSTHANIVNYVLVGHTLLRRQCVDGALVSDRAVASSVQDVDVSCAPTADCSGAPTSISVTVTETTDPNGTAYTFTLGGTFRKLIGDGPPSNPKSVILLGTGGTCSGNSDGISITGSGSMRVYGDAFINTADVNSNCTAMFIQNSAIWKAGGTKFLTGGTCKSGTNGLLCPTSSTYSPAVTDPYAAKIAAGTMTAPATGGTTLSGCAGPGYYPNGFSLGGGSSCTLASGVYVVANGFTISNGATVTTASGGVLIYLVSGQFSVAGGASLTLTAQTSGQYSGLAFWQAAADTNVISWSNGGSLVFNGAIYAPKAQLNVQGNSQTPYVTSLVVQSIILGNSGGLTVGSASASPLSISSTALDNWTVNQPSYSFTPVVNGGDGLYSYAATNLPAGLSIDSNSGEISGKPTAAITKTVSVTVTDQLGDDPVSKNLSITINGAPSISTASLPNGEIGASYSKTLTPSGGTSGYSWSATGLPAGLSINSSTGVIYGTPTGSAGNATVNLTLTDAAGATATKNNLSLTVVSAVTISTGSLPAGEKTIAYNQTVAAGGGATAYSWSAIGLPSPLVINSSTGAITGTPAASGTTSVSITVTDSLGGTDTDSLSLTINPQPTITSVALGNKATAPVGTAGTIEQGDTITVVFSTAMKASSICSAWTSDTTNYTISTDTTLAVNISNGTGSTNDILTVSTPSTCTTAWNFGTTGINLGSNAYDSVAATFKGSGTGATTISWNYSTRTLVITLGAKTAGTMGPVASSTPVWTAGAIKDTQGAALGNSPFTLTAGKQF